MSGGYYAKPSLYTVGEGNNEAYILFYSQAQYPALAAAELASLPNTSPDISTLRYFNSSTYCSAGGNTYYRNS